MKKIIIIAICFSFFTTYSQEAKLEKANEKYEDLDYIDASKIYLKVAESGYESEELLKKLGNLYYFKSNYTEAEKWYNKLYTLNSTTLDSEYLLRYSQSLRATGKTMEAEEVYNQFLNASKILNEEFSSSSDYLNIIRENSNRYNIEPLSINSTSIDYGAFLQKETFYFASTRNLKKRHLVDAWIDEPFLDIYEVHYNRKENTFGEPFLLNGKVNTKFHESSPVITKDGKTLYFTRTNFTPRIKKSKGEQVQLKIYRATKIGDEWTNVEDLSINGDNYSNAHPALSPDERILYFVSNMPSAIGQTDIFSAVINKDGSFGKPKNLGTKVNTKGRESFPFITNSHELYFSSDGHFGLGGYDVFYIDLKKTGRQLLNVGTPVNSTADDYAFSIDNRNQRGFFSSNRSEVDNIYGFTETKPITELFEVTFTGKILDTATGEPIQNAILFIESEDGGTKDKVSTNEKGVFVSSINKFKSYTITLTSDDYDTTDFFLKKGESPFGIDFKMERNIFKIMKNGNTDLSKVLNINSIYFGLDEFSITKKSEVELEKIVQAMKTYPNLKIDVRSHTDNRASASYNMLLSNKRAKATIDYLIKRGINKARLTGKGYGETQLINSCIKCSENEHQENRRSEFIIMNNHKN